MESAQQQFQLRNIERRRRAATEVNRRWHKVARTVVAPYQFLQERLTKSRGLRAIQQILVKSAIRANACTEGDMNVDVVNRITLCHSGRSRGIPRQNLAVN